MPTNCEWIETEIQGVLLGRLTPHVDDRGSFTELFRNAWTDRIEPVQWNLVRSRPGVLRGVHVHIHHSDFLHAAVGTMLVGLADLRTDSPTHSRACVVPLSESEPAGLLIPPGVAHGFYHVDSSIHVYSVDRYWNTDDELGCRWDDPGLNIPWPEIRPQISDRDASLPLLTTLKATLADQRARMRRSSGT